MNELASRVRHRRTRSTNEKVEFFPMNHKNKRHDQSEYVPSSEAGNFYTDLINIVSKVITFLKYDNFFTTKIIIDLNKSVEAFLFLINVLLIRMIS